MKRISDQKALNEETEDLMAAQAKEFDEMEEKTRETEIRLRGQVKTVTSALDEASTLVEKREVQLAALESEIARVRRELHETKTSEEGFKSNPCVKRGIDMTHPLRSFFLSLFFFFLGWGGVARGH